MKKILLNSVTTEHCQLDTTPFSFIIKLKSNFKTPDIETVELVNDSEYFQRIEILWGDLVEWL